MSLVYQSTRSRLEGELNGPNYVLLFFVAGSAFFISIQYSVIMGEWGDKETIEIEAKSLSSGTKLVADRRKGVFSIDLRRKQDSTAYPGSEDEDEDYYHKDNDDRALIVHVDHVSSCKMKIEKISFHYEKISEAENVIVGGSDEPRVKTLVTKRYGWTTQNSGTVVIELRMSIKCPCPSCSLHTRETSPLSSLERLLDSSESSDVVLSVADVEFPAHKLILTSRYDYFKTLFSAGLKESRTNRVQIQGIDPGYFGKVLKFIYSGIIPADIESHAVAYLEIADRYDMRDLKSVCSKVLLRCFSTDLVFDYISLARKYDCPEILAAVIDSTKKSSYKKKYSDELFTPAARHLSIAFQNQDRDLTAVCVNVLKAGVQILATVAQ